MGKGYIMSSQPSLFGHGVIIGFGDDDYSVREIPRAMANRLIIENHYSGKVYNLSYIHLGVYAGGTLDGVMQFGYAMNPASAAGVVANTPNDGYLELNRMWFRHGARKDGKSQAMAYAVRYIRRKYPRVKWIQSFADERCGKYGLVYQACNYVYCGEHPAVFWELDGVWYHNIIMTATRGKGGGTASATLRKNKARAVSHTLRQFRYIYFIDRAAMKNLLLPILPPPKYYGETP